MTAYAFTASAGQRLRFHCLQHLQCNNEQICDERRAHAAGLLLQNRLCDVLWDAGGDQANGRYIIRAPQHAQPLLWSTPPQPNVMFTFCSAESIVRTVETLALRKRVLVCPICDRRLVHIEQKRLELSPDSIQAGFGSVQSLVEDSSLPTSGSRQPARRRRAVARQKRAER